MISAILKWGFIHLKALRWTFLVTPVSLKGIWCVLPKMLPVVFWNINGHYMNEMLQKMLMELPKMLAEGQKMLSGVTKILAAREKWS